MGRAHGEGSLIKRNGCRFWYAQYYKDGRQIRVSTKETVKQKALVELRRLMGDSERGLPSPADLNRITYGDLRAALINNYVEKGNKSLATRANGDETIVGLPQLDAFFGFNVNSAGAPVTRITTDAAREFVRKRKAEGAGSAMINRSLSLLRRMLRIAYEDGKIPAVPKIRLLKEPPARKGFLEEEKFNELLKLLPTHLRPLILFLYWCGVRLGEALSIEWSQIDLDNRLVRLEEEQTKADEPRVVPLPSVLINLFSEVAPKVGKVFSAENLRIEWEKACAACGLGTRVGMEGARHARNDRKNPRSVHYSWYKYTGLLVHDLRRSAVRNLRLAGVPETVIMKITGHKTANVFRRYNIVSTDDLSEAMRRRETAVIANGAKTVQNGRLPVRSTSRKQLKASKMGA